MSRVLVAYFSVSNVTRNVARELAEVEKADLVEIRPETPYTGEDLDWTDKHSRSTREMSNPDCRPAITDYPESIDEYDVIFVGFPIWWGREPSVVDTFLEKYDFNGKKIIPFCTSGGSGIGKTAERIRTLVSETAAVDEGRRLGGHISEKDLKVWTEGLGL